MQDNWKRLAQALLDEEDYLNKQTRAFRKTRLANIKMMRKELSIQEIACANRLISLISDIIPPHF